MFRMLACKSLADYWNTVKVEIPSCQRGAAANKKAANAGKRCRGSSRRNSQRKEAYAVRIDIASLKLP
jgi:hypothetical protein